MDNEVMNSTKVLTQIYQSRSMMHDIFEQLHHLSVSLYNYIDHDSEAEKIMDKIFSLLE